MKQMTTRRLAALGLAAAMGLTLAACGQNPTDTPPAEETLLVDGESGAPEELFKNPQSPETRDFLSRFMEN